ncbi:MAG: Arc family DNA-binding protein [Nevskiales bacterium]
MKTVPTFPLRLPRSLRMAIEKAARQEGTSMNQFLAMAAAEKLAAIDTEAFFTERRQRADLKAFERILKRKGGQPPRPGDET